MIQRIQTLYLSATAALLALLFAWPFAQLLAPGQEVFELFAHALKPQPNPGLGFSLVPMLLLCIICLFITTSTILLFRRRMLQIRLCVANFIMMIGLQGLLYFYVRSVAVGLGAETSYSLPFIFPIVAAILTFLALRAIARDEALVRSLDRLR